MSGERHPLSKRTRFEVFKRDGFQCVYCGSTPPNVVLHIDHVVAVSEGGTDDGDNLVTACSGCNLGKSSVSLNVVPKPLALSGEELREREDQLREYQALLMARRQRLDDEMWNIAEELDSDTEKNGFRRDWLRSIRNFLEKLGYDSVLDSAEIARARYPYGGRKTFLYFCGICWNRVRGEHG
jgi:hypothetical protein